mgnify:CR=1 FL=1
MVRYWRVEARCGHVKKNKFIIKSFFVKAENGEEAAKIVRWLPRVKHHHKKAIFDVNEIDRETYLQGVKTNQSDPYFKASCKQEHSAGFYKVSKNATADGTQELLVSCDSKYPQFTEDLWAFCLINNNFVI